MSLRSTSKPSFWGFLRAVKSHWLTLMSGGVITVLLGLFERFSGQSIPLWVYIGVLIFFVFLACYLSWQDAQTALLSHDKEAKKREYIIERLRGFIQEGLEQRSWGGLRYSKIENWGRIELMHTYPERVENFLRDNLDEAYVERYRDKRAQALEDIVRELLDS